VILAVRAAACALAVAAAAGPTDGARLRPWTRGDTPALAGRDLAGKSVDLRALRGRVVLVEFWASWCEPCAAQLPATARLRERLRDRPFEVLTVNFGEGAERARSFVEEHGVTLPVLLDRDRALGAAWGVGGLPISFLVDAEGRVRSWIFGEADFTKGELATALERLLAAAERHARRGER
jgi:peroxiredoxin